MAELSKGGSAIVANTSAAANKSNASVRNTSVDGKGETVCKIFASASSSLNTSSNESAIHNKCQSGAHQSAIRRLEIRNYPAYSPARNRRGGLRGPHRGGGWGGER